jgi:hypothetical protein
MVICRNTQTQSETCPTVRPATQRSRASISEPAPICGSMIACSTPRLRASYREPKCGRMYWMNTTSAGRLTIRFDPGARSAISDARMFTVVCSVSLVTAHQFDADLIELKPTTRNDGRRRPSSLQPACDHQCFPSKCRLCENGKRTF